MLSVNPSGIIKLSILLIFFLTVIWNGISSSLAQDSELSVPPSFSVTMFASDMREIANWLESGQYLQDGNAKPELRFEAWPYDSDPFISAMMVEWQEGRQLDVSPSKNFCAFVEDKRNSWGSSGGKLGYEIAKAATELIEDYDAFSSDLEYNSWNTAELQRAISDNRDRHPALPVLEGALASIVQMDVELQLINEAVAACRSGAMIANNSMTIGVGDPVDRPGINQLIRALAKSGVSDFTFRFVDLPRLDLRDLELGHITIQQAGIAGLDLTNSTLSSLTVENAVMARCVAAEQCGGRFIFENAKVSGSVNFLNLDVFGYLDVDRIKVDGDIRLSGVNINRPESTRLRLVENYGFEGVEADTLLSANGAGEGDEGADALSLFAATIGGSTTIINSEFRGYTHLGRSQHGELRVAGTHFDGKLDLWGSNISGPTFFGHTASGASVPGVTVTGEFNAWYANFDDLQITHAWIGGQLILQHARIGGTLLIESSNLRGELVLHHSKLDGALIFTNSDFLGRVRAENLRLNSVSITNVAAQNINMRGSRVDGEFLVKESHIARMDLVLSHMRGLSYWDSYDSSSKTIRPKAECLELPIVNADAPKFGTAKDMRKSTISHIRPNCSGVIVAHSIVVDNGVYLSGHIEKHIDLTQSQVRGSTVLSGKAIAYGTNSCLLMRDADLQSVILDSPSGDTDETVRTAPRSIDAYGAQFEVIRASEPVSIADRNQAALTLIDVFEKPDGELCTLDGLKADKPADTSARTPKTHKISDYYMPGVYDALATGYEAAGDVDMARIVKIEKNRAYAEALTDMVQSTGVMLERAVYAVSDRINGFGYRNLNAVFWLLGLISTGYLLSWIAAKQVGRTSAEMGAINLAQSRATEVKQPSLNRLMFSLDRAIPTLALDTTFGTHSGIPMPNWLSLWFYIQRIACFLIVILILAGAFEVFQ